MLAGSPGRSGATGPGRALLLDETRAYARA